ncbi:hypothetical protein [Streptomyces tauricus]|uniref:hypothetical protein n=1 Tax=Streptomyces tauricus TaxID=68274 RepID=UPI00224350BE|nr:hypothetical protein [Streptomyces tauricus]MCW8101654.1 hypothetical protein [Streptomyces tauricus]
MNQQSMEDRFDAWGIGGCRSLIAKDLELVGKLQVSHDRRVRIHKEMRAASTRRRLALNYLPSAHGYLGLLWGLVCFIAVVVFINLGEGGLESKIGPRDARGSVLSIGFIILTLATFRPLLRRLVNSSSILIQSLTAVVLSLLSLIAVSSAFGLKSGIYRPESKDEAWLAASYAVTVVCLSAFEARRRASHRRVRKMSHAYDGMALALLEVIVKIQEERKRWRRDGIVSGWVSELEKLAEMATYAFACPHRAPVGHNAVKVELRAEARRISEIFRSHKKDLMCATSTVNIDEVVASLTVGLEATLAADRERLLQNAPEVPREDIRDLWKRVRPGLTLILFGALLPLLPGPSGMQDATGYIRWTLIVAGAVMLVSSNNEVISRVNESFGKGLLMKQ